MGLGNKVEAAKNAVLRARQAASGGLGSVPFSTSDDGVMIGDSLDGQSYDEINAEITRRDWDRFEQDDIPYILNYANDVVGGMYSDRAIEQARDGVNRGYDLSQKTQERADRSLGAGLSDAVVSGREKSMSRSRTASLIDAENNARSAGYDRDMSLLSGANLTRSQST